MTPLLQIFRWMPLLWSLSTANEGPVHTAYSGGANSLLFIESNYKESYDWTRLSHANDSEMLNSLSHHEFLNDPSFNAYWFNDQLFVYDDFSYDQLPEEIMIDLLGDKGQFTLPWKGMLNSPFGMRWGRPHRGIDLDLRTGDTVVSAFDGVVRYARYNKGGYGNCIVIRHANGLETLYGHLSKIHVEENQYVESGEMIGKGGSTGKSDGPHLHFETRYKDFAFDPLRFFHPGNQQMTVRYLHILKRELNRFRYAEEEEKAIREIKKSRKNIHSRSASASVSSHRRKYHTVKKGESVNSIAKKYGTTRTRISQLNGISKYEKLRPGKKLRIK